MKRALRFKAGMEESPLSMGGGVYARVFRVAAEWASPAWGGVWTLAIPVAVVDRRGARAIVRPVLDPRAVVVAAGALFLLANTLRPRRQI